ncbi:hypothetical protein LTS17_011120 [Exophiala oligosperma]
MSALPITEAHDATGTRASSQAEVLTALLAHILENVLRLVDVMPHSPYILSLLSLDLLYRRVYGYPAALAYFRYIGDLSTVQAAPPKKDAIDLGDWSLRTHGTSNFPRKAAAEILSAIPGSQGFCLWPDGNLEIIMLLGKLVKWYSKPDIPCLAGIRIRLSQLQIAGSDTITTERMRCLLTRKLCAQVSKPVSSLKRLNEVKSYLLARARHRKLQTQNVWKWRSRSQMARLRKQTALLQKSLLHHVSVSTSRPSRKGIAFSSSPPTTRDTQPLQEEATAMHEIWQQKQSEYRDATSRVLNSSRNERHHGQCSRKHTSAVCSEADTVPPPVAPQLNGTVATKRLDSGTHEANGIVQEPTMAAISRASTAPEDVPLPPTPPPAESLSDTIETIPPPAAISTRWITSPCHVKIGNSVSTAGVKVRQANSTEHFVTISTYAAYEGSCKKPLPYCKPKTRKLFGRKSGKPLPDLVGVSVQEASTRDVEVGKIFENTDITSAAHDNLVFPNEFPQDVSLVGPVSSTTRLANRAALVWSERINSDGVSLRILGDNEQAESFVAGTYFDRPLPVKHGKEKHELSAKDIRRSLLYRRNGRPPEDAGKFRGAPVVLRDAKGGYKEVIGFECFHFKPMHAQHEELGMDSKDVIQRIISGHVTTIYGAIKLTREFKQKWQIVDE